MISMDCRVKPGNDEIGLTLGLCMRSRSVRLPLLLLVVALSLAACITSRNEAPASAGMSEDDDAFCQAGGKVAVGSPQYVYCRRDRDAARNAAISKANRSQEGLADWMLNHPDIH
jgi:hypothetical protein